MKKGDKPAIILDQLRDFDFGHAGISLWVFKKRRKADRSIAFPSVWVSTSRNLTKALKEIMSEYRDSIQEVSEYSLLHQPHDSEVLSIHSELTEFHQLRESVDRVQEECEVTDRKQLDNAAGYVVKARLKGKTIYCVRKVVSEWKTARAAGVVNLIFQQHKLDIEEDPIFRVSRIFDFVEVDDNLLISNKRAFESLLNFRAAYESAFAELGKEESFVRLFTHMEPLQKVVLGNAMHLRRMAVIRQRGFYKEPEYMGRLRQVNGAKGWGIQFDGNGCITPTKDTVSVILQVLLDHRLYSELSLKNYDVPSTTPV